MKKFFKDLSAEFGPVKIQGKRSVTTQPSGHELDSARGAFGKGCFRFAPLLFGRLVVVAPESTMRAKPTTSKRSVPNRSLSSKAFAIVLGLAVMLAGCGNPQESARKELAKLGKDFNSAAFIESVANGDKLAVKLFLDAGINVNEPEKNGTTALMAASSKGDHETVQMLLDRGAKPNVQNIDGITALMTAAGKGDHRTVQALLDRGADPNVQKNDGVTALHIAATAGNAGIVSALLEKKADPNLTVTSTVTEGVTPLMAAAMGGHIEAARLLLAKGADVNAKAANGFTAADFATDQNLLKLFRDNGAPVVTDTDLKNLLDWFHRDLGTQARRDMEYGNTPDACRKFVAETLSSFEQDRFNSNQLFQARTCAFDALGTAIHSFALSTVTSGIDLAREKAKPFMAFREELGKEIARHN